MLRSGRLDPYPDKREKHFQILQDESEHLLSLTNKVLTLSKLENYQLRLVKEEVQLRPMLEDLIGKYTAKAEKPVHFSLRLESEWGYADEEFLQEALSNLIDNSIKYSGEEADIQISSSYQTDKSFLIEVRDNGMGIPLKDQSRIFEKYECASAADRSRKGGAPGFGLGLNYVFRVAEAHGGKVNVESIEGEYSEFSLSLPDETLVSYRGFQWNLLQNPLGRVQYIRMCRAMLAYVWLDACIRAGLHVTNQSLLLNKIRRHGV